MRHKWLWGGVIVTLPPLGHEWLWAQEEVRLDTNTSMTNTTPPPAHMDARSYGVDHMDTR